MTFGHCEERLKGSDEAISSRSYLNALIVRGNKDILKRFVVFILVFTFAYCLLTVACFAKDYRYARWDVDLTINKDSSIDVVETITQEFNGDFTGGYRDIYYGDNILLTVTSYLYNNWY